jgi:adenosylhomocysteine nucleosidase
MLDHFKPQQVIFTGIAGGVNPNLSPGDIVIGTVVAHHDYGTITPDSMLLRPTRNPMSMIENPIYFPGDSGLLALAARAAGTVVLDSITRQKARTIPTITKGAIVTGDVFVSSVAATQTLRKKMNAEATEMEGAAVAQACWQQQVPFVVIRSLSDNAGDNAYDDVKKFYQIAAKNSAGLVVAILGLLAAGK